MSTKNKDKFKFVIFIVIIVTALAFVGVNWRTIRNLKIETIVEFVKTKGPYAIFIYLLIFMLKPFMVFIPSNVLVICGGIVFGPFKGTIISILGFWISATVAFYISRILEKDFVQSIIGDKLINLDNKLKGSEFKAVFLLRVIPILPYDPLSYACGFANISYFNFAIASVLGVLPETFCYNVMGKNASNPLSLKFMLPLAVVIIIALFSKKFFNIKKLK